MPGCAAFGCSNRAEAGFRMLAFPGNEERRKQWAIAVNRADINQKGALWKPTKYSYLCEKHFTDDQWEKVRIDGKRKLRSTAIPTIFPQTASKAKRRKLTLGQQHPTSDNERSDPSAETVVDLQQQCKEEPGCSVEDSHINTHECELRDKLKELEDYIQAQQRQISALKNKVNDGATTSDCDVEPYPCELEVETATNDVDDVCSNSSSILTGENQTTSHTVVQSAEFQISTPRPCTVKKRKQDDEYRSAVQLIAKTVQEDVDDETDLFVKFLGAEFKKIKCEKKKRDVRLKLMKVLYESLDE